MLDFLRENQFLVGALSGSLAAYLLGLFVNYLKRQKKWLGYAVESSVVIDANIPDASLVFKGKHATSVCTHQIIIKNIGNVALKNIPCNIAIKDPGKIIDFDYRAPPGLKFDILKENENSLNFEIALLNKAESIVIRITDVNNRDLSIEFLSRQEDMELKSIDNLIAMDVVSRIFLNKFVGFIAPDRDLANEIKRQMFKKWYG